jgi:poly(3-hydroxybutyrate) depolymerase
LRFQNSERQRRHKSFNQRGAMWEDTVMIRSLRATVAALTITAALAAAPMAAAQTAAEPLPLPPFSPSSVVPGLAGIITTSGQPDDVKAQARQLWMRGATINRQGTPGEAWRSLEQARALALGRPWTAKEEYAASLVLRADTPVTDPARPLFVRLAQRYPATYRPADGLQLKLSLIEATTGRKVVRDLGTLEGIRLDLIERPAGFTVDLEGLAAGRYHLVADIADGNAPLGRSEVSLWVVPNFDRQYAEVRKRLAEVKGSDGTKARILYPFDLARVINSGNRETALFDYAAEIARSMEMLAALEAGRDPLHQAKGDLKKAYWFADAGEVMPYRIYVPSKWTPSERLPMVVFLHGLNSDENTAFEWPLGRNVAARLDGALAKMAEERGVIAVAPLGFRVSANYGGAPTFLNQESNPQPGERLAVPDPWDRRAFALAERDTLNVIDMVAKEYNADPARMYLIGNSAGMGGTLYLAGKDPQRWAAIAPSALPYNALSFHPFDRYKGLPVMLVHADNDPIANVRNSRTLLDHLKAAGVDATYHEVKGLEVATAHNLPWVAALPQIFDFLLKNKR